MKAWIQTDSTGDFYNVNAFIANEGFRSLGWDTAKFHQLHEIKSLDPEELIVGGIATVRNQLERLGFSHSGMEIDYPDSLKKYLHRNLWSSTLEELMHNEEQWNVFVKPKNETKKFAGKVIRKHLDFVGLINPDSPTEIWCSEIIPFLTEWRCFIRYGEILDIRRYKGAWDTHPDVAVIRNAVADFRDAPASYALDFAIDTSGRMVLVEVNDGHSLGSYGIQPTDYARFLSARWAEMSHTKDYLNF